MELAETVPIGARGLSRGYVCLPLRVDKRGMERSGIGTIKYQIPHLTRDTIWEKDKNTRTHNKQERQEVSPVPDGVHDHKAERTEKVQQRQYET